MDHDVQDKSEVKSELIKKKKKKEIKPSHRK